MWKGRKSRWIFFSAALLIFGGLTAFSGVSDVLVGMQSRNWPTTEGTITLSKMGTGSHRPRRSFRGRRTYYYPEVQYRYRAGDRDLLSERITGDSPRAFGMRVTDSSRTDSAEVQQVLSQYPESATVRVYYDPDDPSRSVLEPGTTNDAMLHAALGLLMVIAGAGLLIYRLRSQ